MAIEQYKNYVHDLGLLIKEKARRAKIERDSNLETSDANYKLGYLMAYYEVVSLMKQQSDSFEIDQGTIGLGDIEPDKELLWNEITSLCSAGLANEKRGERTQAGLAAARARGRLSGRQKRLDAASRWRVALHGARQSIHVVDGIQLNLAFVAGNWQHQCWLTEAAHLGIHSYIYSL